MRLRFVLPLTLLATGVAAHADTFTLTGANVNISFSIPAMPSSQYSKDPTVDVEAFYVDPVAVTVNGKANNEVVNFYTAKDGGGLSIAAMGQGLKNTKGSGLLVDTGGMQLFTGSLSSPTFTFGAFTLEDESGADGVSPTYKENFLLTIAPDPKTVLPVTPVAGTPEPSSLALLGTGLLGVAGAVRRRLA